MKSLFLLLLLFTIIHQGKLWAQPVECSSFCVENIWLDTVEPGILYVTIHFTGDSNAFINYPYVSEISDVNGENVATGTLNFFGQFANTSQDYQMTTWLDSLDEDFSAILLFFYDTVYCVLPYPCLTSSVTDSQDELQIAVYPNPVSSELIIETEKSFEDAVVHVFSLAGQLVIKLDQVHESSIRVDCSGLVPGMYYLRTIDANGNAIVKKITKIH